MLSLLFSRRFGPMFSAMALGAFNDNFYKNALIILITYQLAASLSINASVLINIAAACFILPFFLFSGIAGVIADRYGKARLVRIYKITELLLCALTIPALLTDHFWGLMLLLFLFGTQSAFFGPVKYAILPELIGREKLLAGNGMIEAGTFICILLGTIFGGLLILMPSGPEMVSAAMLALGVIGVIAGYAVPQTQPQEPELPLRYNIVATTHAMLRFAASERRVFYAILGISWFWAVGTIYLTQLPVFTKELIGGDASVVTFFLALFSVGVGAGSLACQYVLKGHVESRLPLTMLIGICLFGIDLCWAATHITPGATLLGFAEYFNSLNHIRVAFDLFMLAFCGGVFIVPLYTQLQLETPENLRARAIASNNVVNALFISIAAVGAALLYVVGLSVFEVLILFALLNLPVLAFMRRYGR